MHSIGVDISSFISNTKIEKYDFEDIQKETIQITQALKNFQRKNKIISRLKMN